MLNVNYKGTRLACYFGYITQALVINLAPIFFVIFQDFYSISNEGLGTLVLINFVVQILTDLVSVKLTAKISMRLCAVFAHLFAFLGLVFLGLLPTVLPNTFIALTIATITYSIGGGLTEVVISPIIDAISLEESAKSSKKAAAMAFLHSFYCWGQMAVVLVTTLLLFLVGTSLWFLLPFIWATIPFFNGIAFMVVPFPHFVEGEERTPVGRMLTSKIFIIAMILMICSGASELTVSQWASILAEKGLGISKVAGDLLGPCAFALFMGVGRTLYGIKGSKFSLSKALLVCSITCTLSYIMISLVPNPVVALVGCSLCGLSVSIMWPGVLSLASGEFPKGGAALFSLLAVCGDTGCSLGPWLTGLVSGLINTESLSKISVFKALSPEQTALKAGVFAAIVFPVVMIFATVAFVKRKKKSGKN